MVDDDRFVNIDTMSKAACLKKLSIVTCDKVTTVGGCGSIDITFTACMKKTTINTSIMIHERSSIIAFFIIRCPGWLIGGFTISRYVCICR